MKRLIKRQMRRLRDEQGNTIVLTALLLVLLLGMVALVVDGGMLYVTESQLQKTANAAALSGAQELTSTEANVKEVVNTVLSEHKESNSLTAVTVAMRDKVTVELKRDVSFGFARLLGFASAPVRVKAAAKLWSMGSAKGVSPIGIDDSVQLIFGKEYKLKVDQTGASNGNFGALALGGNGASTYRDNLKVGYDGELKVGDIIDTEPGNMAGPTRDGVQYRIDQSPYPEGDISHRDDSRIILVPVYKQISEKGGRKPVQITGFAYFYLMMPMDDKDKSITGMFIERAGIGSTGTGSSEPEAVNKGAYAIRLTE